MLLTRPRRRPAPAASTDSSVQQFSSFARSVGERVPTAPLLGGKLVRAAGPLISRAASSYARAASSAVSYVPSQILVFLHRHHR